MKIKEYYVYKDAGLFGRIREILNATWFDADYARDLNFDYFRIRSGEKECALDPMVVNGSDYVYDADGNQVYAFGHPVVADEPDRFRDIARVIVMRYGSKWKTTYDTFVSQYDPLQEALLTDTETPDITRTVSDKESASTKQTTDSKVTSTESTGYVYGFGGSDKTPATHTDGSSSGETTVQGGKADNQRDFSRTDRETGSRKRTSVRTGGDYAGRADAFLRFRQKTLSEMIEKDVDSILTVPFYF